jgi:DNA-binding NarL/FixJ family response regulator
MSASLGTPIVGLLYDGAQALEAQAIGLKGLVQRDISAAALSAALVAVVNGMVVQDASFDAASQDGDRRLPLPPAEPLTPREMEVLRLLARGLPNKAIAHQLDVTDHTVKFHVNSILAKLNVQSRTEAVVNATRLGLILL